MWLSYRAVRRFEYNEGQVRAATVDFWQARQSQWQSYLRHAADAATAAVLYFSKTAVLPVLLLVAALQVVVQAILKRKVLVLFLPKFRGKGSNCPTCTRGSNGSWLLMLLQPQVYFFDKIACKLSRQPPAAFLPAEASNLLQ